MSKDARPTLAAPDDDPYLWLEEVESKRSLDWVEEQNAATLALFSGRSVDAARDALVAIYDRPDKIPAISRQGEFVYNLWTDSEHRRGLWRRTTLAEFTSDNPSWESVLDIDALAEEEGEDWQWGGVVTGAFQRELAMVRLSLGGGDAVVTREFDTARKTFLPEGFVVPASKGTVAWLDCDHLLVVSSDGDGKATRSGYPRTVRLWKRGETLGNAKILFEVPFTSMCARTFVDTANGEESIWFIENLTRFDTNYWLGNRSGPRKRLDLPSDVQVEMHGDWLAVKPRKPLEIGGHTYLPDTVVATSLSRFVDGHREFQVLFAPTARRVLKTFFWCGPLLVIAILDDLNPVFETCRPRAGDWSKSAIQGLPTTGVVNVWPLDAERGGERSDLLASAEDTITAPSLLLLAQDKGPLVLKRSLAVFAANGLVMSRHEATSSDGERIPYVQVGPPGLSGDAPVHLYAYGGFGHTVLPEYSPALGKLWLEPGGTSVIAQIRGGGEFGTRWHEAARLAGRSLAYDDFAAVAQDLVTRGVTRPSRIAAEGASNGGLLIANMLARYPDRFGALLCAVPLVDMRRYTKLLAGANWIAEYGDPDKPEEWHFLKTISAYHLTVPGRTYPPILLATLRKDDRVHPGHARKMAAKLQAMGYEAYFYEPGTGGHGYGADNQARAQFVALGFSFLRDRIGWSPRVATA